MKADYDFSRGERGKFYNPEAELQLPIYLESDVRDRINHLSEKTGISIQTLVNEWLRSNLQLIESVEGTSEKAE
ncbi:MAG: hypothetical protein ACFBSC_01825 [Microcoleaceae cyanobacterium]